MHVKQQGSSGQYHELTINAPQADVERGAECCNIQSRAHTEAYIVNLHLTLTGLVLSEVLPLQYAKRGCSGFEQPPLLC